MDQTTEGVSMQLPRLKLLRERAYLTQRELAAKSDVAEVTIARMEAGHSASFSTIKKLAQALGVSPDDLTRPLGDDEKPERLAS